jgi:lipooligosaccharide transport system permease protein
MSDAVADPAVGRAPGAGTRALPARLTHALPMLRVAEREARIWGRLWHTSLLTGVLMPLLFLGAMGVGLGDLVDDNSGSVAGLDYLVFVAPGILAATALQAASGDSLWPVMAGIKWVKSFHAAAATPLSPGQVFGGWVTWTTARLLINATLFVIVAALLGGVPSWWGVLAPLAAALGGLAFAAPLTAYSAAQDSDLSFPIIMRLAVVPMFLFSGTFFPVDQLPDWLEPLARLTPLWHAVELCRGATTGSITLVGAIGHTAFLLAIVGLGCWAGTRTFRSRIAP